MPRTLPWQVKTEPRKSTTPASSSSRTLAQVSRSATDSEKDSAAARVKRPGRASRSPLTSPLREPPPEGFMREGLEKDDLYIMVEDEFLATAQAFTRHLHYAEYVRRKKQAKLANISNISRPTDGKTKLSNEAKKRIEADEASAKHKTALDGFKAAARRPPVDSEVEDVDESEEDRDDDPWMGTQLQPLMAATRQPRSLVCLHGIKSSTKAALARSTVPGKAQTSFGLGMNSTAQRSSSHNIRQQVNIEDDDNHPTEARSRALPAIPTQRGTQVALKVPIKPDSRLPPLPSCRDTDAGSRPTQPTTEPIAEPKYKASASGPHTDTTKPRAAISKEPTNSRSSTYTSRFSKFLDELDEPIATMKVEDDFDEPVFKARPAQEPKPFKRRERDEKLRKERLSEVPTFL